MIDKIELHVKRQVLTPISTIGKMTATADGENIPEIDFYTLEDTKQEHKVYGQTRIPAGRYEVGLANWGKAVRYNPRYEDIRHRGMLAVKNVPNFAGILIHPGNNKDDTEGCILVGGVKGPNWIGQSGPAYRVLYPIIADALDNGTEVWITVEDEG